MELNEQEIRAARKNEHISNFLKMEKHSKDYFKDINLFHNALPDINFEEIDTSYEFLNKKISLPFMINAITGGTEDTKVINKNLATLARKFNIPMAVGSQTVALKDKRSRDSFTIVRDIIGDGVVISNLSATSPYENVLKVIEMVDADAVQLHLNVAQEICMPEGDREFKGILRNIENIIKNISKPVIVKEVGFGISYEAAKKLSEIGVKYIDVGGKGGTNFIEIENMRNPVFDYSEFFSWGIPTPQSLVLCKKADYNFKLIASGGISKAEHIVKSLILGAEIAGVSGKILRTLKLKGIYEAEKEIEGLAHKIRVLMLLLGCKNIEQLKNLNYIYEYEKELNHYIK